ncbi:MAG: DUF1549 domain-containing protein [Pirellulaceae bacterium]
MTATGFLRTAARWNRLGRSRSPAAANATIADTLDIVSTALLGLTVGCAPRCHDHRYDHSQPDRLPSAPPSSNPLWIGNSGSCPSSAPIAIHGRRQTTAPRPVSASQT